MAEPARGAARRLPLPVRGVIPVCALLFAVAGCGGGGAPAALLVATTSTYDSGLLEHLVTRYREAHPYRSVKTVAVGSGEALELGRRGDADLLLVHSPEAEREFVDEGHGRDRVPLMYNDFVLVGPPGDPAGVAGTASAARALRQVARHRAPFLSRGDESGTHRRELQLWRRTGDVPEGAWYRETGQGQGETLLIASEREAYTLTDRATFASLEHTLRLRILCEHDPALVNVYSLIRVADAANPAAADALFRWLTSADAHEAIARFGSREEDGPPLFSPLVVGEELPSSEPVPAPRAAPPDSVRGPSPAAVPAGRGG